MAQLCCILATPYCLVKARRECEERGSPRGRAVRERDQTRRNLALARWMCGETKLEDPELCLSPELEPVPADVLACNFWLLSAAESSEHIAQGWYPSQEKSLPVSGLMRQWVAGWLKPSQPSDKGMGIAQPVNLQTTPQSQRHETNSDSPEAIEQIKPAGFSGENNHPIAHYLLLPSYEWGIDEWYLDMTRRFVKEHQPTLGCSIAEASLARRVTVVGGVQAFPDSIIETLRDAGCAVERMIADGTVLAT